LIATADLNVMGADAKAIWGKQWIKLLALLYEGATAGLGTPDKTMGGSTAEGKSARVRVQLEIERIVAAA
jgi:nucleoporin GLE1